MNCRPISTEMFTVVSARSIDRSHFDEAKFRYGETLYSDERLLRVESVRSSDGRSGLIAVPKSALTAN